ncbi:hypothetical protein ACFVYD_04400 [Streptomyces sp. NPDC058301]|uniref:hypothetical protein n=1 Tax=Streptomyces sp. NPDC058301 TaxID=3346436 RepID=UPI0036E676F2
MTTSSFTGVLSEVTAAGGTDHVRLTIPMHGATFAASPGGSAVTLTAGKDAPPLTLDVSADGVRWSVSRPVEFRMTPAQVTLPGPVPVTLSLTTLKLAVDDGALVVDAGGTLGIDGVPASIPLSLPFAVRGGRSGFEGGQQDRSQGPATYTLSWSQARDPFPSAIDVVYAFAAPATGPISGAACYAGVSRARVRLTRHTAGYATTLAVEASDTGVLWSEDTTIAALGVLATAAAGDTAAAPGQTESAPIDELISAAAVLGSGLGTAGAARVTAVRFDLTAGQRARVDYEAELSCAIDAHFLQANTTAPMRVVVRDALLDYSGAKPTLSLAGASIDVSDAGLWEVTRPARLLQVAGVRSGHGSSFFELDLRVATDLGPLKVGGAVLRVSLAENRASPAENPVPRVAVKGFTLAVDVPELVSGEGQLAFDETGDFTAALRVEITPLNLTASAGLVVEKAEDDGRPYRSVLADLACDLPAPLPLANTGLGLFGIEALLGLNRKTQITAGQNRESIKQRLSWKPEAANTTATPDGRLFGAGVAIGTLPDLGFAFSGLGRLVVATPDIAVVAALDAQLLAERRKVTEDPSTTGMTALLGLLAVSSKEVYAGASATYQFPAGAGWKLFEAEAPAEARYPCTDPQKWIVHLGGDGKQRCGPIRATVLPQLFNIGAEAFLMLHGDGFAPPLDLPQSPANGFAAAAGFSLATQYGSPPVWADLSLGAMVALGTRPLFVEGHGHADGGLHLGPFSLGLHAVLDLQLGPGDHWFAKLQACGSIDLWFCEISGCVHIGFGDPPPKAVRDMPGNPLVSATVADPAGVAAPHPAELPSQPQGDIPAMWPDGTVLLGFAPGPAYLGPATDPFHDDLDQTSPKKGAGTLAAPDGTTGSTAYPAHWSLTGMGLHRLTAGGGSQPVAGPLPARWQLAPGAEPLRPGSGRVLALLTHNHALWSLSLADGAASDPADPVAVHARTCRGEWPTTAGWAVGGRAVAEGTGWNLPPIEDGPAPVTTSRVRAAATTTLHTGTPPDSVPAVFDWARLLPPGTALVPGAVVPDGLYPADELPVFQGRLNLADIVASSRQEGQDTIWAETTLVTDSPLTPAARVGRAPTLVLWSEQDFRGVQVLSDTHRGGQSPRPGAQTHGEAAWKLSETVPAASGGVLGVYVWPGDEPVGSVRVRRASRWATGELLHPTLGVVAIGGTTTAAAQAADDARSAAEAAAKAHPTTHGQTADPFPEGATYRVDVTWTGSLDGDPRAPTGDTQSRYFSIAKHAPKVPPPEILPPHELYRSVATFHPKMLGRYLSGYTVDGVQPWFWKDDITATFSSRTIARVAQVYGYDLKVVVNRTDPPVCPPTKDPGFALLLDLALSTTQKQSTPSKRYELLTAVDKRGVTRLDEPCVWPCEAVDVEFDAGLEAEHSYEVGVLADPHDTTARGDPQLPDRVRTMLPTASFRTGFWGSPALMLDALGFDQSDPPLRHTVVPRTVTAPGEDSDGALRSALLAAGADLGPLEERTRTTVLWAPDGNGGHAVTAVLLEATEPLVRGNRVGNYTLDGFTTHTDSGATSVLFVANLPVAGGQLGLEWYERYNTGQKKWLQHHTAVLDVPAPATLPALAWEVWP